MEWGSVNAAMIFIGPPHSGHTVTSIRLRAFIDSAKVGREAFGARIAIEELTIGYATLCAVFEPIDEDGVGVSAFEFGNARGVEGFDAIGIFGCDIIQ